VEKVVFSTAPIEQVKPLLLFVAMAGGIASALPSYSAAGVVNAATGQPVLAPNTFATIYGRDLANSTRQLQSADVEGGLLPVHLPGTGVRVFLDGLAAPVWYVSPTQVNFVVPPNLLPGREARLWLAVDGRQGPEVLVRIAAASPGLFLSDPETVLAVGLDGGVIRNEAPARPGQDVVLFATGLGPVTPGMGYREVAERPSPLVRIGELRVLLNGVAVPPERVRYAGAAPGFAGLYQINLWLPGDAPANPLLQVAVGDQSSQPGVRLAVVLH
jgi:uncharacterized protein (TIGR03437 family)